jgi:4-alpha-glucanotransferase
MNPDNYEQALNRAADLWGIVPEYWDIWGKKHLTSRETKRAILSALGVPTGSAEELEAAVRDRLDAEASRLVPPCLVVSEEAPREIEVRWEGPVEVTLRREDGRVETWQARGGKVALPADLPLGYHDVEVAANERRDALRLIVTPDRAYTDGGRAAGIAVALYGLRSAANWGCGDFRDLRSLIDWVADDLNASFVALNPLHAIHNRRPFNTSPYLPNCVYYQNFLYLDVEGIEDFRRSRRAQCLWNTPAVQKEVEELRASELVEYERVAALKLRFLKLAFLEFVRREYRPNTERSRQFREYVRREGSLLVDFSTYCALDEQIRRADPDIWVWPEWPDHYQDPDSDQTRTFRRRHWRSVLFYQYVQWQIDLQLAAAQEHARDRGLSIGLYHDLALATDRCGSDLWAHPSYYAQQCRVGSPPDDFSPRGQDWAFPPPCSDHHRQTGYRLFSESIRKNARHGGALRIDHVMRFFRLYWIPDGADATRGAYVRDRYEDLIRIVALESVRNRVIIVGEDLGTVEPVVRKTLARFGILSYRLFYFEKREDGRFREFKEYPVQALVSSTTHDLPTLAGFWSNQDIEARRQAGLLNEEQYRSQIGLRLQEKQRMLNTLESLDLLPAHFPRNAAEVPEMTGELHHAVVGFLASTPSQLLALNQEDLTKETAQQNLPGTTWQYPNWSRKMRFSLEQLRSEKAACDFTAMFRYWLERTGRLNGSPAP